LVSLFLNLSYWVLMYFLPLQSAVGFVPFGQFVGQAIPRTFEEFVRKYAPISFMLLLLFSGAPGPATIHVIRSQKVEGGKRERGTRALVILQLLCYLSWIVLALTLVGLRLGGGEFTMFVRDYVPLFVPSTLLHLSFIAVVEGGHPRLWSFRTRSAN